MSDDDNRYGYIKLSVLLPQVAIDAITEMAKAKGISRTEEILRAISLQKFLFDEIGCGGKVLVEKSNGKIVWVRPK